MSLEKAEEYLKNKGMLDHVIRLEDSTATVVEAAQALGVEPEMIAKTMSFLRDDQPVLILTEGTAKIDNRKYKDAFHVKAKMIPFEQPQERGCVHGLRLAPRDKNGRTSVKGIYAASARSESTKA